MTHIEPAPLSKLLHLSQAERDELLAFLTAIHLEPPNPAVEPPYSTALSLQSKQRVIQLVQQYTLIHLRTYPQTLQLLLKPEAESRPELDSEFVRSLLKQLGQLSNPAVWPIDEDITSLVSRLQLKRLRSIVTLFNQLCELSGQTSRKINQHHADRIGGWHRVCFLILSGSTVRQLLSFDIAQCTASLAEAQRRDPTIRPPNDASPIPAQPMAAAMTPIFLNMFEINKPPGLVPLNVEEAVFLSDVQPELKYLPECTLCNRSLLKFGLLGRYPKCVHATAFHLACFSQHFLNDALKRTILRPVRCPVYGCGWSYRPSEMNLLEVTPDSFRPAPDPESTVPDSQAPAVGVMVIE